MKKFTLVELLIVVAILALLMSLLLPSLVSARAKARSAVCLSNQSQLYRGYMKHCLTGTTRDAVKKSLHGDSISDESCHAPGQVLSKHWVARRVRVIGLGLKDTDNVRSQLNCPESQRVTIYSAYGYNVQGNNMHDGKRSDRLFISQIEKTSELILKGCRDPRDGSSHKLSKNNQLAAFHPQSRGNITMFDGHSSWTTWQKLLDSDNKPALQ